MYGFRQGKKQGLEVRVTLDEEIEVLKQQEASLQFASFNADVAFTLGCDLREMAKAATKPVAIGIWMAGQTLFYTGTNGIAPGNEDWLRRKRNTVLRFGKSSLLVGSELMKSGTTLEEKQGLQLSDYAAHGGGFPVLLRGSGCVGAVVVSGLTQREDHAMVVAALSKRLQTSVAQLP